MSVKILSLRPKKTPFKHQPGGVTDSINDGDAEEGGEHHHPTPAISDDPNASL